MSRTDFQDALVWLARGTPSEGPAREVARHLLQTREPSPPEAEWVEMSGQWVLETYRDQTDSLLPSSQTGPCR